MTTRPAVDPDVLSRVAALTYRAQRAVDGVLTGAHRSPHRGASVVFVEHRDYRPGDDPRLIDWRAYGRSDRFMIKRFEQESHLRAHVVLDASGSMAYGKPGETKLDHAATLLLALTFVFLRQSDAAAATRLAKEGPRWVAARARSTHLDAIASLLAEPADVGVATTVGDGLEATVEQAPRRGVVAFASDLVGADPALFAALRRLRQRGNDVIVFHVLHADEVRFPFHESARFTGLEGEASVDADADGAREAYLLELTRFRADAEARCRDAGARYFFAPTDAAPELVLADVLRGNTRGSWASSTR